MKCWSKIDDDLSTSIDWWNIYKNNLEHNFGFADNLKLFNIQSEMLLSPDDVNMFFVISCDTLKRMFADDFAEYKLYWYTGVEVNALQPKVSHFKKVWKELKPKWNFEGFTLGPEINVMYHNTNYYVGIAEFDGAVFPNNSLFKNMLQKGVVFASNRPNLLSEDFLSEFSLHSHSVKETRGFYNFDYINLIKRLSLDGYIIIVYENNYESRKICLPFKEEMSKILRKYEGVFR